MMVGGPDAGGQAPRADPRRARPAARPRSTGRAGGTWARPGAGHYVKMVHNGIEYGMMQAYAEGFELFDASRVRARQREDRPPLDAGLGRALVAVRAGRAGLRAGGQRPRGARALRRGLRRGPLDGRGRDRQATSRRRCITRVALRALLLARATATSPRKVNAALRAQFGGHAVAEGGQTVSPTSPDAADNPLVEGLERLPVHPTTLVIFGATGDLAKRKLLPALYNLAHEGALPERFHLIGVVAQRHARRGLPRAGRARRSASSRRREPDETVLEALLARRPLRAGLVRRRRRSTSSSAGARRVRRGGRPAAQPRLLPLDRARVLPGDRRAARRRRASTATRTPRSGCIIEKPFGTTLAGGHASSTSACSAVFDERQVFRIDHYLGKETVQNMLAFRFANGMFEPLWNRNYIDNVQITAAEDIGIGTRAGYYDNAGALRDLVQNHMLQLLCPVAWSRRSTSPPTRSATRRSRSCTRSARPTPEDVDRHGGARAVRGRAPSAARRSRATSRRTACPHDSNTETYAALRLEIENWRWAGVPFYLRTGKRLARKVTEIAVTLQAGPAPRLHAGRARSACSPTSSSSRCSPTRACRSRSARRSPARGCGSAR